MSLRRATQSLVSALGKNGVRLRLNDTELPQVKRELTKIKKQASERGRDTLKEAVSIGNSFASAQLAKLGQNVKSRYRSRQVPSVDRLTGRTFPKSYPIDRSGGLRNALIQTKVTRRQRSTFDRGVEAVIDITASSVPVSQRGSGTTNYPNLNKVTKDKPIQTFGGRSDLFSMMEFGTGFMRYSDRPYETFSGQVFSKTQGYFVLDRIVKDEFFNLTKRFNQDLRDEIRRKVT